MNSYHINHKRLSYLGDKVKLGTATKSERDEFIWILFQNGSISESQYNDYKNNNNADEIIKAALAIGVVILIGYLIEHIFSSK